MKSLIWPHIDTFMPFITGPIKTYNSVDYNTISSKLPKCHRFTVIITFVFKLSDNFYLLFYITFSYCVLFSDFLARLFTMKTKTTVSDKIIYCFILFNKINKCITFITLRTTFPLPHNLLNSFFSQRKHKFYF